MASFKVIGDYLIEPISFWSNMNQIVLGYMAPTANNCPWLDVLSNAQDAFYNDKKLYLPSYLPLDVERSGFMPFPKAFVWSEYKLCHNWKLNFILCAIDHEVTYLYHLQGQSQKIWCVHILPMEKCWFSQLQLMHVFSYLWLYLIQFLTSQQLTILFWVSWIFVYFRLTSRLEQIYLTQRWDPNRYYYSQWTWE